MDYFRSKVQIKLQCTTFGFATINFKVSIMNVILEKANLQRISNISRVSFGLNRTAYSLNYTTTQQVRIA